MSTQFVQGVVFVAALSSTFVFGGDHNKQNLAITLRAGDKSKTRKPAVASKPRRQKRRLKPFKRPKKVTLVRVTPKELAQRIAKHKGQAVLVSYWATWCQPCVRQFPHVVDLADEHASSGLVVITICVDTNENFARAREFLKNQDVRLVNLISSDKVDPENLYGAFGVTSLPDYRVYGPDGKLVKRLCGSKDDKSKVDAAVEKALEFE